MKVLFVCPINPKNMKPGGTGVYLINLMEGLREAGVDVTLIGRDSAETGKTEPMQVGSQTINFISFGGDKVSGYKFLLNLFLKSWKLKFNSKTIIHAQRPDHMLPFILFHRRNPKICSMHGIPERTIYIKKGRLVGAIYELIERFSLRHTDYVIATNKGTMDYYVKKYPWLADRISVITIGVNTSRFTLMDKSKMRRKYKLDAGDKILIYVGRLEKEKNVTLLLECYALIKEKLGKVRLVIVGEGRERQKLEKLAGDLKLDDVVFTGALNHAEIPEIMNCGDVFVLGSLHDSAPLSVIESLSCGVPVVSVDVGRVREIIKDTKAGRIVDRNKESMCGGVLEMLQTRDESTRKYCREIAERYDFSYTVADTVKLYESVTKKIAFYFISN